MFRIVLTALAVSMLLTTALFAADNAAGRHTQVVMQAYENYVNGNIDGIVALTTDDVDWGGVGPASAGGPFVILHGHGGVQQWFEGLATASAPYKLMNLRFNEDGDTVLVTGDLETSFAATGQTLTGPFAHIFRFRGDKIAWFRIYMDSAAYQASSGVIGISEGQSNIARVQAAYTAFGQGDMDQLASYFTEDIRWELVGPQDRNPLLGVHSGKQAVMQWFVQLASTIELQPFEDLHYFADGDTVVVTGLNHGKYRSSGTEVVTPFVHIFKFRNGQVYWFREQADSYAEANAY